MIKKINEVENEAINKLQYHKGSGSYLLTIPIEFVRETQLENRWIKVTLLKDGNILLQKVTQHER